MKYEIGQVIEYLDETDYTKLPYESLGHSNDTEHFLAKIYAITESTIKTTVICTLLSSIKDRPVHFRQPGSTIELYHTSSDLPFIKEPDKLSLGYILNVKG